MASVVVIEDDKILRESLVECLQLNDFDASGVESALEFYNLMSTASPTVAVVDIGLPDQNGFILTDYIRRNSSMGIIILTARGAMEDRVKGYDSGADVYLVKPVKCMELAAAVRSLAARREEKGVFAPADPGEDSWRLNTRSCELLPPESDPIRLTDKEECFLRILCEAEDNRCERADLLDGLGYQQDEYGDRALNSLVLRLRKKIESVTGAETPIRTAHAVGFFFADPIAIA